MPLVVAVTEPSGTLPPELAQWSPVSALGEPLGNVGPVAIGQTSAIVTALIGGQYGVAASKGDPTGPLQTTWTSFDDQTNRASRQTRASQRRPPSW